MTSNSADHELNHYYAAHYDSAYQSEKYIINIQQVSAAALSRPTIGGTTSLTHKLTRNWRIIAGSHKSETHSVISAGTLPGNNKGEQQYN